MRKSMTAYGRATIQTKLAHWTLEISSVNRKGLDVHLHLPHTLLFLDPMLRKCVGQMAERGNLTIRIACEIQEVSSLVKMLKKEKERWQQVSQELKLSKDSITLPFLLSQMTPQEVVSDPKAFEKDLEIVWKKASHVWNTMKIQEGKVLTDDIQSRLKTISKEMKQIEKALPKVVHAHVERLKERMEELKISVDPQQLMEKAALEADRDDVTEEMIRLASHIDQMKLYLKSSEKSVGRTLDFLAQEMGREIGTLMAKAGSSEIAKHAVHIKSEIEKIREQVQNIE